MEVFSFDRYFFNQFPSKACCGTIAANPHLLPTCSFPYHIIIIISVRCEAYKAAEQGRGEPMIDVPVGVHGLENTG